MEVACLAAVGGVLSGSLLAVVGLVVTAWPNVGAGQ